MWYPLSLKRPPRRRPGRTVRLHCEPLEDRLVPATIAPEEQLFVYLLNRARHDPVAYQQEQNLSVSLAGIAPQSPLAVNDDLFASTEFHATDMATRFYFSHTTPDGLTPNQMVRNAGYTLNSIFAPTGNNVESIAAGTVIDTAAEALNLLLVDQGVSPPGHRIHLLAMSSFFEAHREIGVGHAFNNSDPTNLKNYWSIHTAYTNSTDKFLTGVVFNDANGNQRYDLGEGLSGVTVSIGSTSVQTNAAGGWSIPVSGTRTVTVTVSGGGFNGVSTSQVTVGADNIEVDFISGRANGIVDFDTSSTPTVNSAPVLDAAATPTLPTSNEDTISTSMTIASLMGTAISDADVGALKGIAVTGVSAGGWQYSTNGTTFLSFGAPADSAALLLRGTDRIRFAPPANFNGSATFTFHAWDQTSGTAGGTADLTAGTGGSTAFSDNEATASITVNPVNDAPVLAAASPILPAVAVNDTNPAGIRVGSLLGGFIADVDAGALQGIAIIKAASSKAGVWQFSTDGVTFVNLGSVSSKSARLLDDSDFIRFVPNPGYTMTKSTSKLPSFTYRAWDETSGSAGQVGKITSTGKTTAFSAATQIAGVRVNTAPVLTAAAKPAFAPLASTASFNITVATLLGGLVQDVGKGVLAGIAITDATVSPGGKWQISINGGRSYQDLGTPSLAAARLLRATDRLRYVPLAGSSGTATISFHAWDQTTGLAGQTFDLSQPGSAGAETAFSAAGDTRSLTVS